jgi:hypothetical protein
MTEDDIPPPDKPDPIALYMAIYQVSFPEAVSRLMQHALDGTDWREVISAKIIPFPTKPQNK